MQFAPQQWTDHHTHRLYHLARLVIFGMITTTLVCGMFGQLVTWAQADETTYPANTPAPVTVSATVPEVTSGTTTPAGSGGISYGAGVTSVVPTPGAVTPIGNQFTLYPLNNDRAVGRQTGQKEFPYYFQDRQPEFTGSSTPQTQVYFVVNGYSNLTAAAEVDRSGNWQWTVPVALTPGAYSIAAEIQNSENGSFIVLRQIYIVVEQQGNHGSASAPSLPGIIQSSPGSSVQPPAGQNGLWFLLASVQPSDKQVRGGAAVTLRLQFVNLPATQLTIEYTVTDPSGQVVYQQSEQLNAQTGSYLKTFHLNVAADSGVYTVVVKATAGNQASAASDNFTVLGPAPAAVQSNPSPPVDHVYSFDLLFVLLAMFLAVLYLEYRKVHMHSQMIRQLENKESA